jgi:hypothetical protein
MKNSLTLMKNSLTLVKDPRWRSDEGLGFASRKNVVKGESFVSEANHSRPKGALHER